MQLPVSLLDPISLKIKKSTPKKNSLDFRKWNFLALRLKKNFLYFLKTIFFLYSRKRNFLIFWETEPSRPKTKKIQEGTFWARKVKNPEKASYISKSGIF